MCGHGITGIFLALVLALVPLAYGGLAQSAGMLPDARQQDRDLTYGTSQLESHNYTDKGRVSQWHDPETGDEVTSVVPPRQPRQQQYGTILVAPQVYPDWPMGGDIWGHGSRSGGPSRPSPFGPSAGAGGPNGGRP